MSAGLLSDTATAYPSSTTGTVGSTPSPAVPAPAALDAQRGEIRLRAPRIESLDAARFVAVAGVIFVHSAESHELLKLGLVGTFGVPFYLFAALYFQARSFRRQPDRPLHTYAWARAKRLYLPFLAWSLIYLIARNVKHALLGGGLVRPEVEDLWVGTAHHLWFLPFLMVVTLLAAMANRACRRRVRLRWWVIMASAVVGTILAIAPRPDWLNHINGASQLGLHGSEGYFFFQCWRALPSVFLGLALAWWLALDHTDALMPVAMGFAGILLTVATVGNQLIYGYSRLDRTLSGLGWLIASLAAWRGPIVTRLAALGQHGYGIYLVHVLLVEGFQAVGHKVGADRSMAFDACTFVVALVGSLAVTCVIDRSKKLAWLNG